MKSSKIIFFLAICFIARQSHVYAWGTDTIKEGMTNAATISGEALKEAAPKIGQESAQILAEAITQTAPQASAKLGAEGAEKLAKAVNESSKAFSGIATHAVWALGLFSGAFAAKQLWDIGKDVKSYGWPSMEEKARALENHEKYVLLKTRKELKECLTSKSTQQKGALGLPSDCENFAHAFARAAGDEELDKLTKTFNKHYRQQ